MTTTESDLRAEAVDLIRHIAEAIYNADTGGLSRYNAPVWMFADADTIERYTRMAAAARRVFEVDVERRLERALDVEGTARAIRLAHEEIRAQLRTFMDLITEHMQGEPGDDDEVDVCNAVKHTLAELADLIEFDHAGWFDVPGVGV
jgi:acyl-CoA reductase-like NAD-dependent aldehyde dehydrogenase